jgi:diguanylate cyclase (GGDEF)-like protein/PAS domain S-box-containing protein
VAIFGAPTIALIVLVTHLSHGHSHAPAAGVVVAVVNGVVATQLIRLAWRRHGAGTPCRSAGMLGLGMIALALTGAALAVVYTAAVQHPHEVGEEVAANTAAAIVAGGLALATAAFLPALLLMPGAARSSTARARHALDGLSVGICLLFASWLLVISPNGTVESLGFWIAILTCCALAQAAVTGLRTGVARPAVLACSAAVAAAVVGLNGLAFSLASGWLLVWPLIFSTFLVVAPLLAWTGARRMSAIENMAPVDGRPTLAGFPLLAGPAAIAIAVALYRVVSDQPFDRPSMLLGLLGIGVVALRESLAALDVSRYAGRVVAQEAQFRSLIAGSTDVIMVLDGDLIVRWQSAASARLFGLSDQEVVGRHLQSMVHPDDAVYVADRLADVCAGFGCTDRPTLIEARLRDGFGQWRETESSAADQRALPEVGGIVVHIRDVTERKDMERALHRLSFADQLTGLANRRQMLLSIVAQRCVPRVRGALLLVELDGFNAVNDVRGFDIGDAVLVEVARRLRAGTAETDLPARLGGDEFAIVTDTSPVQAYALATRLLMMLAEPIVLPNVTVHLTASIGMADVAGGSSVDDVLRRADLALRRAKQLGRGRVEWYDAAVEAEMLRRMTLEQDLPGALVRGELDLIYQPILDLVASRPLAVEALLRWRHPRLGTLLPADVIPVAEDVGLIHEIGSWVLHQSGRQLAAWLREGRDLSMAVNVSPMQLEGPQLADDIAGVLDVHELPAERLVLEVAEGGLGADAARVHEQLLRVRSLGVRTALDEFGTGAESLTHLRTLPMDMVKIGRTFFAESSDGPSASVPIIDVMVGLGRRLGVDIVAQGLEAPAHLDVVRAAGCRLGQGHLFARPQPAERVEAYLDGFGARTA